MTPTSLKPNMILQDSAECPNQYQCAKAARQKEMGMNLLHSLALLTRKDMELKFNLKLYLSNFSFFCTMNPTVEGTKEHMGYHSYGNKAEALGSLIKGYCIASEKWVQEEGPEYFLMPRVLFLISFSFYILFTDIFDSFKGDHQNYSINVQNQPRSSA
ncbi:hypothetical protein HGM15179_016493 [Zosterops borbonicus]|uniref:Uncharacterized protein n=1 Tax=Zosterops borbonicus TaxID=364589 RepID=A0A8K1G2Q7_9PASS|nr:hypothetical protein HGM15179_016493 [Zosterops borbonicus]